MYVIFSILIAMIGAGLVVLCVRKSRWPRAMATCPRCKYSLTGLARPLCPECGVEVSSASRRPPLARRVLVITIATVFASAWVYSWGLPGRLGVSRLIPSTILVIGSSLPGQPGATHLAERAVPGGLFEWQENRLLRLEYARSTGLRSPLVDIYQFETGSIVATPAPQPGLYDLRARVRLRFTSPDAQGTFETEITPSRVLIGAYSAPPPSKPLGLRVESKPESVITVRCQVVGVLASGRVGDVLQEVSESVDIRRARGFKELP